MGAAFRAIVPLTHGQKIMPSAVAQFFFFLTGTLVGSANKMCPCLSNALQKYNLPSFSLKKAIAPRLFDVYLYYLPSIIYRPPEVMGSSQQERQRENLQQLKA